MSYYINAMQTFHHMAIHHIRAHTPVTDIQLVLSIIHDTLSLQNVQVLIIVSLSLAVTRAIRMLARPIVFPIAQSLRVRLAPILIFVPSVRRCCNARSV